MMSRMWMPLDTTLQTNKEYVSYEWQYISKICSMYTLSGSRHNHYLLSCMLKKMIQCELIRIVFQSSKNKKYSIWLIKINGRKAMLRLLLILLLLILCINYHVASACKCSEFFYNHFSLDMDVIALRPIQISEKYFV